jgi:hypothetical protein
MDDLLQLARLIQTRNQTERQITALIGRPAALGHIGEYIASQVFNITLEQSAAHKRSDGYFRDGPLKGYTVNIKWYAFQEGLLDITPEALPDYYLVLTGLKSAAVTSRKRVRPWTIERVFLFEAQALANELQQIGVKLGVATSVRQYLWQNAEIYPTLQDHLLQVSQTQREALALFRFRDDDHH